jgi:hypothetical protein
VVEFDYFPDSGFGATISPTVISSNGVFASGFNSPLALALNDLYHVELRYAASNLTLSTTVTRNGAPFGPIADVVLDGAAFTDFRVDAFAVSSYSDAGQDPDWDGSIRAHGRLDHVEWEVPEPPVGALTVGVRDGRGTVEFESQTGWVYTLEGAEDLRAWEPASAPTPGVAGRLALTDGRVPGDRVFYRVRAERP